MSPHEKAVVQRLREVQLEDDYVEVEASAEKGPARLHRQPEGLPLSLVESWQTTILKDPKNRCELRISVTGNICSLGLTDAHL